MLGAGSNTRGARRAGGRSAGSWFRGAGPRLRPGLQVTGKTCQALPGPPKAPLPRSRAGTQSPSVLPRVQKGEDRALGLNSETEGQEKRGEQVARSPGFPESPSSKPRTPRVGRTPKHHTQEPHPHPRSRSTWLSLGAGRQAQLDPWLAPNPPRTPGAQARAGVPAAAGGRLAPLRRWDTGVCGASPRTRGIERPRAPPGSLAPPGPPQGPLPASRSLASGRTFPRAVESLAPGPRPDPSLASGSQRPLLPGLQALGALARPQRPAHGRRGTGRGPALPETPPGRPRLRTHSCGRPRPAAPQAGSPRGGRLPGSQGPGSGGDGPLSKSRRFRKPELSGRIECALSAKRHSQGEAHRGGFSGADKGLGQRPL